MPADPSVLDGLGLAGDESLAGLEVELDHVRALLSSQQEIRLFIDGTANLGHQASATQLLKTVATRYAYQGLVRAIYHDGGPRGATLDKLRFLLPGHRVAPGVQTKFAGATVEWLPIGDRTILPVVALGVGCGVDVMPDGNLASELRVQYLLRLQPFMWHRGLDQIEYGNLSPPTTLVIGDARARAFYGRPFYVPEAAGGMPIDWDRMLTEVEDRIAERVKVVRYVLGCIGSGPEAIRLGSIYGVRAPSAHGAAPEDVLSGLLAALVTASGPSPLRGIVINFDRVAPGTDEALRAILDGEPRPRLLSDSALANLQRRRFAVGRDLQEHERGEIRAQTMAERRVGDCVRIVGLPITQEDLTGVLRWLVDRPVGIVLLQLGGPVPPGCFMHCLNRATLLNVFEGQATASAAMSAGRPYLHIPNIAMRLPYRYPPLGPNADRAVARLERGTDALLRAAIDVASFESAVDAAARFVRDVCIEPAPDLPAYYAGLRDFLATPGLDKADLGFIALARVVRDTQDPAYEAPTTAL